MYTKCNKCGAIVSDPGTEFDCPKCGNKLRSRTAFLDRLEAEEEHPPIGQFGEVTPFTVLKGITSAGCLLAMLAYCLFLFLCSLVLIYALPLVGQHISEIEALPFLLIPYPVAITVLEGNAAGAYWAFLGIAMILSLIWMIWPERKKLKETLRDSVGMLRAPTRGNDRTIFIVGQLFLAVLFFDFAYYFLIEAGGAAPTSPAFSEQAMWENMYGFLNASVWEEIAARIILIGVPLLIFRMFVSAHEGRLPGHMDNLGRSTKKVLRLLLGGHNDFGPVVVGLIVFSSAMFGFAHAPGWDLWKILPTALSGLAFGYVYIKKGVHAAIILHFSFDYLGITQELLLPNTFGVWTAMMLIFVIWFLAGMVYFIFYSAKVMRFFVEPEKGWRRPAPRTTMRKTWDLLGWK